MCIAQELHSQIFKTHDILAVCATCSGDAAALTFLEFFWNFFFGIFFWNFFGIFGIFLEFFGIFLEFFFFWNFFGIFWDEL